MSTGFSTTLRDWKIALWTVPVGTGPRSLLRATSPKAPHTNVLCLIPGGVITISDNTNVEGDWFTGTSPGDVAEAWFWLQEALNARDGVFLQFLLPFPPHVGPNGGISTTSPVLWGKDIGVFTNKKAAPTAAEMKKMECPRCHRDRTIYEPKCWWCELPFPDNVPF